MTRVLISDFKCVPLESEYRLPEIRVSRRPVSRIHGLVDSRLITIANLLIRPEHARLTAGLYPEDRASLYVYSLPGAHRSIADRGSNIGRLRLNPE